MVAGTYLRRTDRRKDALMRSTKLLDVSLPEHGELALLGTKLRCIGDDVALRLVHLHTQLEAYERTAECIVEALAVIEELFPRSALANVFPTPALREEQHLREQLGRELRETEREWLRVRGEAQEGIAEVLAEFAELLTKVAMVSNSALPCPSLGELLAFLDLPPAEDRLVAFEIKEVQHRLRRIP